MATPWDLVGDCTGRDDVDFWPDRETDAGPALAVCAGCPVVDACRAYGVERNLGAGVWGGRYWQVTPKPWGWTNARERALRSADSPQDLQCSSTLTNADQR